MKSVKLGTMVRDNISGTDGMLTHLIVNIGGNKEYIFQPKGLNPKTQKPVDKILLQEERIEGGILIDEDVPLDLLGTKAQDIATGFKGKIVSLVYHINGCLHISIKPEGTLKNTGATIEACEFDIRRVKGEKIKPFEELKLQESIKKKPSPDGMPKRHKI